MLFSDLVMPGGMDGLTLAREATGRWPEMRVLLASGYAKGLAERAGLYRFRRRWWASPPAYLLVLFPTAFLGLAPWGLALASIYAIVTLASAIETLRSQV